MLNNKYYNCHQLQIALTTNLTLYHLSLQTGFFLLFDGVPIDEQRAGDTAQVRVPKESQRHPDDTRPHRGWRPRHLAQQHQRPRPRGGRVWPDLGHEWPQRRLQLDDMQSQGQGQVQRKGCELVWRRRGRRWWRSRYLTDNRIGMGTQ